MRRGIVVGAVVLLAVAVVLVALGLPYLPLVHGTTAAEIDGLAAWLQMKPGVHVADVYHHLTDPASINADLQRALRPGGRLLVIDFEPGGIMDWIGGSHAEDRHGGHGTPRGVVVKEVTAAGFRLTRGPEPWRGRLYAVLFTRS